tara:strand:+ start:1405 stop:1752 length:348 start_codon:yes stop_codon:yes gene_type:complete
MNNNNNNNNTFIKQRRNQKAVPYERTVSNINKKPLYYNDPLLQEDKPSYNIWIYSVISLFIIIMIIFIVYFIIYHQQEDVLDKNEKDYRKMIIWVLFGVLAFLLIVLLLLLFLSS